jgi:hypothetical protein
MGKDPIFIKKCPYSERGIILSGWTLRKVRGISLIFNMINPYMKKILGLSLVGDKQII